MISISTKTKKPRLQRGQVLSLSELDVLLDVKVTDFERTVLRLTKEFRTKGIALEIPAGRDLIALKPMDSRVSWARLYEAQVKRLAQMDREDEFLMARRYEFVKARAIAALRDVYGDVEELADMLLQGAEQLEKPPTAPTAAQTALLEQAMREFEALRNHYVEGALYMVLGCAHRYRNMGVDFADLIQEGNASLFQAIEGFDWRRDVRFKTYAQYWIHQAILKVLYNSSRTVRVPIWVQKALSKIQRVRQQDRKADGSAPSAAEVGEKLGLPEERVRELLKTKRHAVSLDAEVSGEEGASLGQLLADDSLPPITEAIEDGDLGATLDEVMADLPSREQMILSRRYGLHGREPETLGEIAEDLGITAERVRQLQKAALGRLQKPVKMTRLRAFA